MKGNKYRFIYPRLSLSVWLSQDDFHKSTPAREGKPAKKRGGCWTCESQNLWKSGPMKGTAKSPMEKEFLIKKISSSSPSVLVLMPAPVRRLPCLRVQLYKLSHEPQLATGLLLPQQQNVNVTRSRKRQYGHKLNSIECHLQRSDYLLIADELLIKLSLQRYRRLRWLTSNRTLLHE